MNKTVKTILCTLCCVLALYGLILLIRKVMLSPDTSRMTKKDLGYSFYLEPFRQTNNIQEQIKNDEKKLKYLEEKLSKNVYYDNEDREDDERRLKEIEEKIKLRSNIDEKCYEKLIKLPNLSELNVLKRCQKK